MDRAVDGLDGLGISEIRPSIGPQIHRDFWASSGFFVVQFPLLHAWLCQIHREHQTDWMKDDAEAIYFLDPFSSLNLRAVTLYVQVEVYRLVVIFPLYS
jgi:hypothetical protein